MLILWTLLSCAGEPAKPPVSTPVQPTAWETAEEPEEEPVIHYSEPADCAEGVAPGSVLGLIRWPYVQWVTDDAATIAWGAPVESVAAELEISRDDLVLTQEAESKVFPFSDAGDEMRLFSTRVTGLEPGTEYCYRVSVDGVELAGGLRFRTAPASEDAPIRFFVIGDFGSGSPDQQRLAEVMARHAEGVNLWLTTGDNAYANGSYGDLHNKVFAVYQALFTRIPLFPTLGNHDYRTLDAQPYLDNFFLPDDAWLDVHKERYYTLHFGPMTLFALDSEKPLINVTDPQSEPVWAEAALTGPSRPWRVAAFHKPVYSGHPTRGPDPLVYLLLMPLFNEHGIDLGLTGHNHFYERFAPLRNDEPDPEGAVWIVTGGGGQGLYETGEAEHREAVHREHHFMLFEMDGCTLHGQAINIEDEVIDDFTLDRCL